MTQPENQEKKIETLSLPYFTITLIGIMGTLFIIGVAYFITWIIGSKIKNEDTRKNFELTTSIVAPMASALYSFIAFYSLEKRKKFEMLKEQKILEEEAKPKIEVSFPVPEQQGKSESIVECKTHLVYINNQNYSIGDATYIRIKIKNVGNKTIRECRAYLKEVKKNGTPIISDFLPLLWAYERQDGRLDGRKIPTGATFYTDILVAYPQYLIPQGSLSSNPPTEGYCFKLKTKNRDSKYDYSIIFGNTTSCPTDTTYYEFQIFVIADECEKNISLQLNYKYNNDKKNGYVEIKQIPENSEFKHQTINLPKDPDEGIIAELRSATLEDMSLKRGGDSSPINSDWKRVIYDAL